MHKASQENPEFLFYIAIMKQILNNLPYFGQCNNIVRIGGVYIYLHPNSAKLGILYCGIILNTIQLIELLCTTNLLSLIKFCIKVKQWKFQYNIWVQPEVLSVYCYKEATLVCVFVGGIIWNNQTCFKNNGGKLMTFLDST